MIKTLTQQVTTWILLSLTLSATAFADTDRVRLFTITRSTNENVVCYDARLDSNQNLSRTNPIEVYWTMDAERGQKEELTWFERKKAYGYSVIRSNELNTVTIALQAFDKRPIEIIKTEDGIYAQMQILKRPALIQNVYVKTTESMVPRVHYIDLSGVDVETGQSVTERITP